MKFLLNDNADENAYQEIIVKMEGEIAEIERKLTEGPMNLSNHENLLVQALDFCQNISKYYASGNIQKN